MKVADKCQTFFFIFSGDAPFSRIFFFIKKQFCLTGLPGPANAWSFLPSRQKILASSFVLAILPRRRQPLGESKRDSREHPVHSFCAVFVRFVRHPCRTILKIAPHCSQFLEAL
ncbi:MAG: hypothetical protein K6F15_03615, partial [Treponema sp.]|nr:hypothetical protein [Treponema sp.]